MADSKNHNMISSDMAKAIITCLALAVDSVADHNSSLCAWRPNTLDVSHVFGRQALPMTWDFAETVSTGDSTGCFIGACKRIADIINRESNCLKLGTGSIGLFSATHQQLPDDSANCMFTDLPTMMQYYMPTFRIFIVWLKRTVSDLYPF